MRGGASPQEHRSSAAQEPLATAIDAAIAALAALRDQLAASRTPQEDVWIGQRQSPLPPRVHTRLCRELRARGDDRAAVRGRTHFLRASMIDEHLRGAGASLSRRSTKEPRCAQPTSAGERLLAELKSVP